MSAEWIVRREYETRIAPRSLVRVYIQKRLHQLARRCIVTPVRLWLYRRMGSRLVAACLSASTPGSTASSPS